MTTAVCKACGELKFGAWLPCGKCRKTTNSLWLSDHFLSSAGLEAVAGMVQRGQSVSFRDCWRHFSIKAWLMVLSLVLGVVTLILDGLGIGT